MFKRFMEGMHVKDKGETCRKRQSMQTGPSERREGRKGAWVGQEEAQAASARPAENP